MVAVVTVFVAPACGGQGQAVRACVCVCKERDEAERLSAGESQKESLKRER